MNWSRGVNAKQIGTNSTGREFPAPIHSQEDRTFKMSPHVPYELLVTNAP